MKLNELKAVTENINLPMEDGFFTKKVDIAQWVEKYVTSFYTIHEDKSVTVNTDVNLQFSSGCNHKRFGYVYPSGHLPLRFRKSLDFCAGNNELTSMKGFPEIVDGDFDASQNKITSFEDSPKEVNGDYDIRWNSIKSLEGISEHISVIKGSFKCDTHAIESGGLGLLNIEGLTGWYSKITPMTPKQKLAHEIINKHLGTGNRDIFACQQELIDAGLEEYAKL